MQTIEQSHRGDPPPFSEQKDELLSRLLEWDFQITEPEPIDASVYTRAREAFVDATADHPAVVAVYGDSATPTVPGISDLDLALVVENDAEDLSDLRAAVDEVMDEYAEVFSHPPILVPEPVFDTLPLFANNTTDLAHLHGKSLETVDPDATAFAVRYFDRFAFKPYGHLLYDLYPILRDDGYASSLMPVKRVLQPVVATKTGRYNSVSETLYIKKSRILSKVAGIDHERKKVVKAFDMQPDINDEVLDRVTTYRQTYFEENVSAEDCLELLIDGLFCRYQLHKAFISHQDLYEPTDGTFHLRQDVPAVATPDWQQAPPHRFLDLFYDSTINGRLLPPEAAHHIAATPGSSELFFDTPPEPAVTDQRVATVLDQRNQALRQYFSFAKQSDGWYDSFKPIPPAAFIDTAAAPRFKSSSAVSGVAEWIRSRRNLAVSKQWNESIRSQDSD